MGLKSLAVGSEGLSASLVQRRNEDLDMRRGLPLGFDEVYRSSYWGDTREVIKQAMVQQETIFQHQVFELHRLYWVQKNLMKDLCSINRLHKTAACNLNSLPREDELKFLGPRRKEPSNTVKILHQGQQRNFNILHTVDVHNKVSSYKPSSTNHSICNGEVIDLEAVDLNLSAEENNNEMDIAERYISHKISHPNEQNLFDLNETIVALSNEEGVGVSSSSVRTPMLCSEVMYESQLPALSDVTSCERKIKDGGCSLPAQLPDAGQNSVCEIQNSTQSATNKKSSPKASQFSFDLNEVQLEESAAIFGDPHLIPSSASGGSSANSNGSTDESHFSTHSHPSHLRDSTSEKGDVLKADMVSVHGNKRGNRSEVLLHWNMQESPETNKLSTGSWNESSDGIAQYHSMGCPESQRFCCGPLSVSRVIERSSNVSPSMLNSNSCKNCEDTSLSSEPPILDTRLVDSDRGKEDLAFHSSFDLSCPLTGAPAAKREEDERSEEDKLSSSTRGDHLLDNDDVSGPWEEQFSARGKFRDITRNNSCSMTCQDPPEPLLMESENHKLKPTDQVTDICGKFIVHDSPNDFVMGKHEETQEASEMDPLVLSAAESLVNIVKDSVNVSQVGQTVLEDEIVHEQPQYSSSDSLESIVLALTEIKVDECSFSSWPTEEAMKDGTCPFKTRSGRRLRDFQKDILPGLVSLSRQEICEDLHAFSEIVKADERSKKGHVRSGRVRNRRSRLYPKRQRR